MAYSMVNARLDRPTLGDHLVRPQWRIPLTQRSGQYAVSKHSPSHVTIRQTAPTTAYLPVDRPVAVTCCTSEAIPSTSGEQDETSLRFLDSLKWGRDGLVAVIVQHVDTGEVLMQAFTDREGLRETLQTRLATFYSRSRKERWCKGETSGNYINVLKIFIDCDRDSIVYLGDPVGPSCHTGAETCWFSEVAIRDGALVESSDQASSLHTPLPTLLALEQTIKQRRADAEGASGGKPSWTAKLLKNPGLLCSKIREEAGELCETLEKDEGKERAASEMADLLYHSMALLNVQGVSLRDVTRVLRSRFGTSGIEEKAARAIAAPSKTAGDDNN